MAALVIRPLAEADIDEAFAWYERRSASLGVDFLRAVDASFVAILATPLSYPQVYRLVRRVLLRRFPYAMFYLIDDDRLEILACVHTRQHSRRWRRRT